MTIDGRDIYLGKYGSERSHAEYDRQLGEWLVNKRKRDVGNDLTINELLVDYIKLCDIYYRRADRLLRSADLPS